MPCYDLSCHTDSLPEVPSGNAVRDLETGAAFGHSGSFLARNDERLTAVFDGIMEAGEAALRGEAVGVPLPAGVR